jgi:hypothetical protein
MDNKLRYSDDLRRRGRRLALPSSFGICHAGRYEFVAEIANAFLRGPDYPDIQATLLRLVAGQIAVQAVIPNFGTAASSLTLTIRRIVCFRYRIRARVGVLATSHDEVTSSLCQTARNANPAE